MPTVRIADISTITDRLIARSGKFAAFFSRAELEAHVAFAMAPQYDAWPDVLGDPLKGVRLGLREKK